MKKANYYRKAQADMEDTCIYYVNRALEIFLNRVTYECEDPDALKYFDPSYAERCIFYDGRDTVWFDEILGSYRCGNVLPGGTFDIYGNPTEWASCPANGTGITYLKDTNAVIIYDTVCKSSPGANATPIVPYLMVLHIVQDMAQLHTARNLNVSSLSCPIIISGTEAQQLSLQNRIKEISVGTPYIFVAVDSNTGNEIKALNTECINNISTFSNELDKEWSALLTYLGTNNVNVVKAERVTDDEVNANNEQITMKAKAVIKARQDGFDKLAAMGYPKVTVKWLGGSAENSAEVFDDNGLPLDEEDEKTEPNVSDGGKGGSDGSSNSSSM